MAMLMSRKNRGKHGEHLCLFCSACNELVTNKRRRMLKRRERQQWKKEL